MKIIYFTLFLIEYIIAGNIDFDSLESYKKNITVSTHNVVVNDLNKVKKEVYQMSGKKTVVDKAINKFVEDMRKQPVIHNSSNIDSSSMTSSSSSTVATSSSKNKQKGVKKIYAHGKGVHGQTYYAIICTQDRSRHGNWQRKDGIWMSFGTMAGHRNQSLSEYAQDFCK